MKAAVLFSGLVALALAGCTPTRVDPAASLPTLERWHNAEAGVAVTDPRSLAAWWQGFRDPVLNRLVTQALAANRDIKAAQARVREARAMLDVAESALYPTIEFSGSGGREKRIDRIIAVPGPQGVKLVTPAANAVSGGLVARWEIDLFGGRRLEAEAAAEQAAGTDEGARAVRVGLLANLATNYLELRGIQARTGILREHIALQQQRLRTVQALFAAGRSNRGDVAGQQTALRSTEAVLPDLLRAADVTIHRLGVLAGEAPTRLQALLAPVAPLPVAAPRLPGLLPAQLLEQRPDLRLAKRTVNATAAALGAAEAELYPRLVLSASGGFGALAVGGYPSLAETVYALGSGLSAPLFNAGRIRAGITAADARLEQSAAEYERTFLTALEDVENAYVGHRAAAEQVEHWASAEEAAAGSWRDAEAFHVRGATDRLSVLDARRAQLEAGEAKARAQTALAVSVVSLYRAFGGGWSAGTDPVASR